MDTISKGFIVSGLYALLGIYLAKKLVFLYHFGEEGINLLPINFFEMLLFALAKFFFILSLFTVYVFAKRDKYSISLKKRLFFVVPLFVGFLIVFLLMHSNFYEYIVPVSLIIYGMVLLTLNRVTTSNLSFLSISLLVLGFASFVLGYSGWLFLALGFGIFPIIFGLINFRRSRS